MASYAELERIVAHQRQQIEAIQTERDWLETDNNIQRASSIHLREKEKELTSRLEEEQKKFTTLKAKYSGVKKGWHKMKEENEKKEKKLEELIALGREMHNDWTFYRNGYYSMIYWQWFRQNYKNVNIIELETVAIAVRSCRKGPVSSPEAEETSLDHEPAEETILEPAEATILEPAEDVNLEPADWNVSLEPAEETILEPAEDVNLEPAEDVSLEPAEVFSPAYTSATSDDHQLSEVECHVKTKKVRNIMI